MSDTVSVVITCCMCNTRFYMTVLARDFATYYTMDQIGPKKDPEEIFPYLSNEEKSLFRGSVCFKCLKSMTGGIL